MCGGVEGVPGGRLGNGYPLLVERGVAGEPERYCSIFISIVTAVLSGASLGGGVDERLSIDLDHALRDILRKSPSPPPIGSVAVLRSALARERSRTDLRWQQSMIHKLQEYSDRNYPR